MFAINDTGNIDDIFEKVSRYNPELVVVGGGDGTVSAAFNALHDKEIKFAIMPLGTSNVFARSLKLPLDIEANLELIKKGKHQPVSLGRVNDQIFVSLATIGFTVTVSENVSDEVKGRFGRLGYVLSGFWHGIKHRPFKATIATLKGQESVTTHQILIANSEIAFPQDVTLGTSIFEPKIGIISYANNKKKLPHLRALIVAMIQKKPPKETLKISTQYAEIATSRKKKVALDGEPFSETPVTVTVLKDAVDVVIP